MKKEKILKILLGKIGEMNVEHIEIADVLQMIGISQRQFHLVFPNGSDEMLMDAIAYAGCRWLYKLRKDIDMAAAPVDKLSLLLNGYALGAENYSENLSLYIDLWKLVKDEKSEYLKNRLGEIYEKYITEFTAIWKKIGVSGLEEEEIHILGVIMTAVSDAIHIQYFTGKHPVEFREIEKFLCSLAKGIVLYFEKKEEEIL